MTPRIPLRVIASSTLQPAVRSHIISRKFPKACTRHVGLQHSRLYQSSVPKLMPKGDRVQSREPPPKRRRIESATQTTMASISSNPPSAMPQIELTPLEQTLRRLLLDVAEYIKLEEGQTAQTGDLVLRFTGGWVRDKLLGVGSHDIDVGISTMTGYKFGLKMKEYLGIPGNLDKYTNGSENALQNVIGGLHKIEANPEKSKHLETVTTRIFGLDIDLVNLRKETYTEESRNPQMEFGTAEEDAYRRDATVNAMFYNLNTASIEDLTGRGLEDMKKKLIRTPLAPYQTFKDDPLRVLRLIRFASRLDYRIDTNTAQAMQHDDIKTALRLKISQERIGIEVEKMLRGPDPLTALRLIDDLKLYDTIFANHMDEVEVETSSWPRAYRSLQAILDDYIGTDARRAIIRNLLIRDDGERYYAWLLAALSPWAVVPTKPQSPGKKELPPRARDVARESLRPDNKTLSIIGASVNQYPLIWSKKSSFLQKELGSELSDIRWNLGKFIRTMGRDWRLCMIHAILLEIMQGGEFGSVLREYEQFLLYIVEQNLHEVELLRPIANGRDIAKALGVKTGPWMAKALEMVIEWQIRNPERSDAEGALEDIKRRKEELILGSK